MPPVRRWGWLTAVAVAVVTSGVARGQMVVDAGRGFTFDIPPGLSSMPLPNVPGVLYAFASTDPRLGVPDVAMTIERSPVNVRPGERVGLPTDAPPGPTMARRPWHGTDVDVMVADTYVGGFPVAARLTVIPLPGGAVRVALFAKQGHHPSADDVLATALNNLHVVGDETGAATAAAASSGNAEGRGAAMGTGLVILGCIGGAAWNVLRH